MGFFGGSSQSTASNNNIVDFNPVINVGEGNTTKLDKALENTQSVSPKVDEGITASVGLGFGGSGSGGQIATSKDNGTTDMQPTLTSGLSSGISSTYLIIGGGILLIMTLFKKKKR